MSVYGCLDDKICIINLRQQQLVILDSEGSKGGFNDNFFMTNWCIANVFLLFY